MRVLLTGARAPVTLDLVRHFHAAGHQVYLADSVRLPLARFSRFAKRTFVVPRPSCNPAGFVEQLAAICERNAIDLVLPTCEEIFYIAARLTLFPPTTTVFALPLHLLEPLHNKWSFSQSVVSPVHAVRAPETHYVACEKDLALWLARPDLSEWVFKPVYSRFAARTLVGPDAEQVAKLQPTATDPWVVQRRIHGQEFSTYSVARDGKLRAHACYRSQYQAGAASGIYFVPVESEVIRHFVESFVAEREFTGQVGFDFKEDVDGQTYVLECNPRATSGVHLFHSVALAQAFTDEDGSLLTPVSLQPSMLASIVLLFSLPQAILQGRLRMLVGDLLRARDVIFAWNDPGPTLLGPLSLAEVVNIACRLGKPLTNAATYDIEWNGESL